MAINDTLGRLEKILNTQMKRAMLEATRDVADYAATHHRFTSRSGNLERSIRSELVSTSPLVGQVALDKDSEAYPYNYFVHEGTGIHGPNRAKWARENGYPIKPKNKKALRWPTAGGFAFSKGHIHPGIKPDPFLYRALEANTDNINAVFSRHIQNAIKGAGLE